MMAEEKNNPDKNQPSKAEGHNQPGEDKQAEMPLFIKSCWINWQQRTDLMQNKVQKQKKRT